MFWTKLSDKSSSYCRLKQLVKQKKNHEVKCLVKNANLSDPVHQHSGVTLLHMSARYNNLDLVKFLVESGVDVDVRDAFGRTPLMTAILHGNFLAVECLLASNADFKTALQLVLTSKVPKHVIKSLLTSLSNSSDLDEIADLLTQNHFPLKYLPLVEDARLTRAILERQSSIDHRQSQYLVRRAMSSTCPSNMQTLAMLTRHGPGSDTRQRIFLAELSCVLDSAFPSRSYLASLFRQLIDLEEESLLEYLEIAFYTHGRRTVALMLDCGVAEHVSRHFGQDLLVYAFGNRRLNAIELLANKGFDVNSSSRGRRGLRALHYAARNGLAKNVRYLLDRGADPNARDDLGITPLFYARDSECLRLLLERGADVQARKADGVTVLDSCTCWATMKVLVAHVALIEARGHTAIEQKTRDRIDELPSLASFYDKCRRQIGWMRRQRCFELHGTTMFAVLAANSVEDVVPFMRHCAEGYRCDFGLCKVLLNWYYYSTLKRRLKRAKEICKMRRKAAKTIVGSVGMFDVDGLVIDKIVGYLTYEDLLVAFK